MTHTTPIPLQTDNAMADSVINGKVQPKQTKAMDLNSTGYAIEKANDSSPFTGNPAS
jgi:hypothetical protein